MQLGNFNICTICLFAKIKKTGQKWNFTTLTRSIFMKWGQIPFLPLILYKKYADFVSKSAYFFGSPSWGSGDKLRQVWQSQTCEPRPDCGHSPCRLWLRTIHRIVRFTRRPLRALLGSTCDAAPGVVFGFDWGSHRQEKSTTFVVPCLWLPQLDSNQRPCG